MQKDDACALNPINCKDGLSFSVWEKIKYKDNVLVEKNSKKKYLVSSGAAYDKDVGTAVPGFSLYHEGPELVATVSTGEQVWTSRITGLIFNDTWTNIGITWKKANLSDLSLPPEKLGGLNVYVNREKVGHTLLPEFTKAGTQTFVPVKQKIDGHEPPVIMLGCGYDYETKKFYGFSGGEYDELAVWKRELGKNATYDEIQFFLGGTDLNIADVDANQFKVLLGGADLSDPNQASVAQDVLSAMMLPPPVKKSAIPTRPPNKTTTISTPAPGDTTTKAMSADELNTLALDQLGLQEVISTMLSSNNVPYVVSPQKVEKRFPLSIVAAKLLSGRDSDNVKKWQAVHQAFPMEEAAPKTLRELNEYMTAWVGATNTSDKDKTDTHWYDPEVETMRYNATGEDFVMNAFKMPERMYRRSPRIVLPVYTSSEWSVNKEAWGNPVDEFSIPTGMFKDKVGCNESDVTFTFSIFNKMDRIWPRRRNMAFIRNIDWAVDCRIFSIDVACNVNPLNVTKETVAAAQLCTPNPDYMKNNPLKYHCEHKLPVRARYVRRPLGTWFSDTEQLGVEVRHCVWWNEEFGSNGAWDPNGCKLIATSHLSTKCQCEKWGAMTVVLEQSMTTVAEDDCDMNNIIKYIGIIVTIILLSIFIGVAALGRGVWDMFHAIRVHVAVTWMLAICFHALTDMKAIRQSAENNLYVGLFMEYFYSASTILISLENHAHFKAFTAGIISGRAKIYYPFAYGLPLIPLGLLFLAYNDHLGLDPRCFVAWNWNAKLFYLLCNFAVTLYGVALAIIIIFNLTHPQTRRKNVVISLRTQAKGSIVLAFGPFVFWICAMATYLHNPESDANDPYCFFIILLGWIGVVYFVTLGPMSRKWRLGIGIEKRDQKYEAAADTCNTEDTSSEATTVLGTPEPSRPTTAASSRPATAASSCPGTVPRPATASTVGEGSRPTTGASRSSRPATAKPEKEADESGGGSGDDGGESGDE